MENREWLGELYRRIAGTRRRRVPVLFQLPYNSSNGVYSRRRITLQGKGRFSSKRHYNSDLSTFSGTILVKELLNDEENW